MARELRPMVRALGLAGTQVAGMQAWARPGTLAVPVGVGPVRAAAGARAVLDAVGVDLVLVIGVAGALDAAARVGTVIAPAHVADAETGAVHRPRAGGGEGTLVTVRRLGDLGRAAHIQDALAVDMETAAIAAECERDGVAWDVRRAVSDLPGTVTPELASILRPDGTPDVGAALRLVARRPAAALGLARLARGSQRAISEVTLAALSLLADGTGRHEG